jgi:CAAX prenyl protease-like protein
VVVFLLPFLAVMAAAMVSGAFKGEIEWLYPLRFFAAAGVLWHYRAEYRRLNWRVSWVGAAVGLVVFALWVGLDRALGIETASGTAAGMGALSGSARYAWLFFRVLAAVVTVPIAEELAFRGFLLRRLASADFESVSCRKFVPVAFAISCLAFGVLHGDRWVAGTLAGAAYAAVFLRRGSIGDAALAHGVTNAALAWWVLSTGAWELW